MVLFNELEEFLKELETDRPLVERKIVRVTYVVQHAMPTRLVVTYKVAGEVVVFTHVCDVGDTEHGKQSRDIKKHIEEECAGLSLEVRAGMYKEGSAQ